MNLSELNDLWKKQSEQNKVWRVRLIEQSKLLHDEVKEILQPPDNKWHDEKNHLIRHYVELFDLSEKPKPVSDSNYEQGSFTYEGELIFGIAVTFKVDGIPTKTSYRPVAVRFKNQEPQFSFIDFNTKNPKSSWDTNIKNFAASLVEEIANHLKFDPFDGPRKLSSIGFI